MLEGHKYVGLAEATVMKLVDAKGNDRLLAALACPHCRGALIVAIKGLQPIHLQNVDAMFLIEALRQGPAFDKLYPSRLNPEKSLVYLQRFPKSEASWMVLFDQGSGSDVCAFICSGAAPYSQPFNCGVYFTPEQRQKFADACLAELMRGAPAPARA